MTSRSPPLVQRVEVNTWFVVHPADGRLEGPKHLGAVLRDREGRHYHDNAHSDA
jgi:hypothetical protein